MRNTSINHPHRALYRCSTPARGALLAGLLLVGVAGGWAQTLHQLGAPTAPPDAVIELWEQSWTLRDNGAIVYHSKQHVRLNSDRAYDEFADPRITYDTKTQKLDVLVARVKLADGSYRKLPEYSHVLVSPNESAGWPAFADIRQHLLVMSGIETGCVVELEYRITSQPGRYDQLAGDLRIHSQYPIRQRTIVIETPKDVKLQAVGTDSLTVPSVLADSFSLKLKDLEARPGESNDAPWQVGEPRFSFSTGPAADVWVCQRTEALRAAADDSPRIQELAAEWTHDAQADSDRMRALQEHLAKRFNFVHFPVNWRPAHERYASDLLSCNNGLPAEAAAALLALASAADLPVRPALLVDDRIWQPDVPQDEMVAAYVVALDTPTGIEIWHPEQGRLMRDAHWAGHTLLWCDGDELQTYQLPAWTSADESRCQITGNITVDVAGQISGDMMLRTAGLFVSPESLRSTGAQKRRVNQLLDHVLPAAKLDDFSVITLSDDEFVASAKISSKPLDKQGGCYLMALAEAAPYTLEISLPLAYTTRKTPVELTGPFDELVELNIEWPEDWTLIGQPRQQVGLTGPWGALAQRVNVDGHQLTLKHSLRIDKGTLPPDQFLSIREPLNELRTEAARTLILKP